MSNANKPSDPPALAVSLLYAASVTARLTNSVATLGRVMREKQGGRWAVVSPGGSVTRFRSKSRARRRARRRGGVVRHWRRSMQEPIWPSFTHPILTDTGRVRIALIHDEFEMSFRSSFEIGIDLSLTKNSDGYGLHDPPYGNNAPIRPVTFAAPWKIPAPSLDDFEKLFREEKES